MKKSDDKFLYLSIMKNILLIVLLHFILIGCLHTQSNTIEISPNLYFSKGHYITNEIPFTPITNELEFIGLSCYHTKQAPASITYRIKVDNQWSEWLPIDVQHEFVVASRIAYQAKPIMQEFSSIQFKTINKIDSGLTIRFFLAEGNEHRDIQVPVIARSVNCEIPEVCDRSCWCPTCPIDDTPQLTEPTHLIVHHSAGNNQSNNFATVVESIWDLHVNTNGWDDIGYNWLIDPNGVLYQGRPDNYQGAHFSCINENTVGICL